jgi:hypothetical protein
MVTHRQRKEVFQDRTVNKNGNKTMTTIPFFPELNFIVILASRCFWDRLKFFIKSIDMLITSTTAISGIMNYCALRKYELPDEKNPA